MAEQKTQGGRAKVKQKMQDGPAKKCKMVQQKNVRWSSKKMQDGRAKK
jgi:hypothetical protein